MYHPPLGRVRALLDPDAPLRTTLPPPILQYQPTEISVRYQVTELIQQAFDRSAIPANIRG